MLSKRNYQERLRKMAPQKERFSIRKFSVGAASVLIGFTFVSMAGSHKVQAADVPDKSVVVDTFNKDKSQELTENKTIEMPKAEKTAVSSVVQKGASANKIEAENTTQVDKNTEGSVKVQENKDAVQPKTVNNENVLNVSKAQSQSNEAVTKNAAESKVAALRAFRAAPQATQSQDAKDFQSLVNAMNDSSIGTSNITNDITITGKVNGLTTFGISDINKHYLYLQSKGSARDLTINGNGHTINFAGYSIALQDKNYHNAAGPWNITLKDMTIEGSKYGYSPISFYSSKTNTENSKLIFDGVTANLNDRPLVDKYGENLPVHFAGDNNIMLNNMSIGYNLVTGKTVKFDSGNTTFNVGGKVTGNAINPDNWVIRSTENASNSENPSTLINEGATVTINAKSDDLRGIYAGRQLTAGQPIYGVTVINGTLNANMAAGHSTAIWSHDLEIGKKGNVTIHTKQTNQADGVENGTSNSVTNYNGTHYAPISLGVGPISSVASPLSKQTASLINNGSLTIIRDTTERTLVPLISMGDGGLSTNTTLKFGVSAGATLDLQDTAGENTPDWIKVDPDTGKVTVSPTDDTSVGSHDISVTVTYPDSSTDQLTVPVTVTEKSNLAEKYPVSYDKLNVEKPSGDTPATGAVDPKAAADMPEGAITGYEKGDFDAPAGVTIDVNHDTGKVTASVGKNATLGSFEVPVKGTYSDGTYAEVKVPVSITGNKVDPGSGDVVYYGDQSMVVFNGNLTTVHKTTDSHELSAKDSAFQTITYYSDWNKKGNIVSDYNKHVIYKLSADGTKYVNEADATDSFDASAISFNWQKGYEVNTGVDNFSNGSADTLYQLENGAVNSEEQTDANDPSGLAGNSKYRYDFSISDTNVLQKLGLSPAGYNAWANVYYNFLGATGKINIPVNYGSEVSTDEAGIKNYLATNSISGKTFVNGNPSGIKWAENGMPGKDGKFAASNMTGIVEFTFDNGTKLNVQVTFKTGSHVQTSGSKVNDDTNLYVERTIEYDVTGTGHSPINSVTQKVHYVRDGYHKINADGTDAGEIIWNEWKLADGQTAEFPEYSVDQITGYDAYINGAKATQVDAAKVAETNGTPQNGQNITVTYKKQNSTPVPYKPGKDGVNDAINRYVTRTIIVKEPGKEPQTITQTVHFTNEDKDGNSGYKDPVTGEIKYNTDWHVASDLKAKTGSWEEYTAPSVTGYTPSQAKVEAKTVTAETEAASVTISYTKNADIPVPYKPGKDGVNDAINRYVTRTINVVDPVTGKISTSVQTAKFTREDKNGNSGYKDPVTGKTTINPWTPAKHGLRAVNVEQINGYVAKVDGNVDAVVVTPDSANMVVTITYQANKPEGQNIAVKKDTVPDPADGIKNKDDLPDGTKYTWEKTPDVSKPGDVPAIVVVTYPDGSKDKVDVHIVVDNPTPEPQDVHTTPGVVPDPSTAIKNKDEMPDGTKYTWKEVPDVNSVGEKTGIVTVTLPDGTSVDVKVNVFVDPVKENNNTIADSNNTNSSDKNTANAATVNGKSENKKTLPQTGSKSDAAAIAGLAVAIAGSLLGLGVNRKKRQK